MKSIRGAFFFGLCRSNRPFERRNMYASLFSIHHVWTAGDTLVDWQHSSSGLTLFLKCAEKSGKNQKQKKHQHKNFYSLAEG